MPQNLLKWPNIPAPELLIVFRELMGGRWQGDFPVKRRSRLHIPKFGDECKVILTFEGSKIVRIEPGKGFDHVQWGIVSAEIESSVLQGQMKVGREYTFSGRRVSGAWRGQSSGVQILPPPDDAPKVPAEQGDHPFVLEFPIMTSTVRGLTNYRRHRKSRDLALLFNILLAGGVKAMAIGHTRHCWTGTEWVQEWFSTPLTPFVTDTLSQQPANRLEGLRPEDYEALTGNDEAGLRVPSDLDESICLYEALPDRDRERFDRAAYWFSTSSRMRDVSTSAAFTALVSAIESLTGAGNVHRFDCPICGHPHEHRFPGPTRLFKHFLLTYAPSSSVGKQRDAMYKLRSLLTHGEHLVEWDREIPALVWTPPGFSEQQQYFDLWILTRMALRNWLKNRVHYLRQARERCAYFRWIERGRPLWDAGVDWSFAEQEYPD